MAVCSHASPPIVSESSEPELFSVVEATLCIRVVPGITCSENGDLVLSSWLHEWGLYLLWQQGSKLRSDPFLSRNTEGMIAHLYSKHFAVLLHVTLHHFALLGRASRHFAPV